MRTYAGCWLATVVTVAFSLVACGHDPVQIRIEDPPLQVKEEGTTPADSTQFLYSPGSPVSLVVNFNRSMDVGEVTQVQLIPRPAQTGTLEIPGTNTRQIVWRDVVLDPVFPAYRMLIDGPSVIAPTVISLYPKENSALQGAISGHVFLSRGTTEPENIVVYALADSLQAFPLTGAEERLFDLPILGMTTTRVLPGIEGGWYKIGGLENFRHYAVLAILDTSGDGRYNTRDDWWGFYRDFRDQPLWVTAGVPLGPLLDPPLASERDDIDFWILAAGSLDFPEF